RALRCESQDADRPVRRAHAGEPRQRRPGDVLAAGPAPGLISFRPPMSTQFVGTKPVEERHRFDEASLERFMKAQVDDFRGPIEVQQFKGGQSNPTYRVSAGGKHYALRRKPPGKLLPSAHAVDREFRVIQALHKTGFPVARPYALCEDESVIGTAFYVMDCVE